MWTGVQLIPWDFCCDEDSLSWLAACGLDWIVCGILLAPRMIRPVWAVSVHLIPGPGSQLFTWRHLSNASNGLDTRVGTRLGSKDTELSVCWMKDGWQMVFQIVDTQRTVEVSVGQWTKSWGKETVAVKIKGEWSGSNEEWVSESSQWLRGVGCELCC